jgi:hypothetical protein
MIRTLVSKFHHESYLTHCKIKERHLYDLYPQLLHVGRTSKSNLLKVCTSYRNASNILKLI